MGLLASTHHDFVQHYTTAYEHMSSYYLSHSERVETCQSPYAQQELAFVMSGAMVSHNYWPKGFASLTRALVSLRQACLNKISTPRDVLISASV